MGERPDVEHVRETVSYQCTLEDDYNDDASSQVETSNNDNSVPEVEADDSERPPAAKKQRKEKGNNPAEGSKRASSYTKKDILAVIERMELERSRQDMEKLQFLKEMQAERLAVMKSLVDTLKQIAETDVDFYHQNNHCSYRYCLVELSDHQCSTRLFCRLCHSVKTLQCSHNCSEIRSRFRFPTFPLKSPM